MHTGKNRPLIFALYLNAALLAAILVALVSRDNVPSILPAAFAQRQAPIAGGAGVFVMPAQFAVNAWGCYLLDVDQQTLCAYQYLPNEKQLRLVAARNYTHDRQLGNFNTDAPSPNEARQLVEQEKLGSRMQAPPADRPPAEPRRNE
jgi:hypothetical protein